MIPIQVELDGFMSYREAAVLNFEGAPLWMLCGRNGSGKSTVFDAMKWALFGTHRGGSQGAEALIHHDRDNLRVAFDFAVGSDVFRVQRTLSRAGRSSFQALKMGAEAAAIPETDSKTGLDRWVAIQIGLNEETFGAAISLQQGKSDALLSADNKTRHAMLTQIVDLAAFERLHELAEQRRKSLSAQSELLQRRLDATEKVDDAEISALSQQMKEVSGRVAIARAAWEENLGLQPQAATWEKLQAETDGLHTELATSRALLGDAETIARDAARLEELSEVLPALESAFGTRERLTKSRLEADKATQDATAARETAQLAQLEKTAREAALGAARDESTKQSATRDTASGRLVELSPALHDVEEWERIGQELGDLEEKLATFAPDLDAQLAQTQAQVETAREIAAALPALKRLKQAREAGQSAERALELARLEAQEHEAALEILKIERGEAELVLQETAANLEIAQRRQTEAQTRLAQATEARGRFESVENQPDCSYCGQPLTPAHREMERARLEGEIKRAQANLERANDELGRARDASEQARKRLLQSGEDLEIRLEAQRGAEEATRSAARERELQTQLALAAREELAPDFASRVEAPDYPSHGELTQLTKTVQNGAALHKTVEELRAQVSTRDALLAQREPSVRRMGQLRKRLGNKIENVHADYQNAAQSFENAQKALDELARQIEELNEELRAITARLSRARDAENEARIAAAAHGATEQELAQRLAQQRAALSPSWQSVFETLSAADLGEYASEKQRLEGSGATQKARQLEEARAQIEQLESRIEKIEREAQKVPEGARDGVLALQKREKELRAELERENAEISRLEREISALKTKRETRLQMEKEVREVERDARHHKLLAEALGRDALQRHLLQEAENQIVEAANDVLDRISSGTLRLELRSEDSEAAGTRRGAPRALDLVVFNTLSGEAPRPMPLSFLSGSQRFRVAVSLALGIGNYATQGARRVEAVIIDEGFGSLDKQGRHEMIDELHGLQSVLKRIILVSHQEEFFDSFSNRYLIEIQDGTSRASLRESEA
jgi:DNA repair exonuclease SbcCD ATPase subunit